MNDRPLRFVVFSMHPLAYELVNQWIEENGHELVLVVTTPGPSTRRNEDYKDLLAVLPVRQEVLVTTRIRTIARPLIEEIAPDMIFSFGFPYRIPPEIFDIPPMGTVNFHPAPLPEFRGPNSILRPIYDDWHELGGTLHWVDADIDTGRILTQETIPMPEPCTLETVIDKSVPMWRRVIRDGMVKALAGDPGRRQDDSKSSYGALFSEDETQLSWETPVELLDRRIWCVNLEPPKTMAPSNVGYASMEIDGVRQVIASSEILNRDVSGKPAGTILRTEGDAQIVQGIDGQLRMQCSVVAEPMIV